MPPAQLNDIMPMLSGDEMTTYLRAFGIRRVVTVRDETGGTEGTSVYLIADPDRGLWQQIMDAPELGVPWPLLGLYGHLGVMMLRPMREQNIAWIPNEVLGAALVELGLDERNEPGQIHGEAADDFRIGVLLWGFQEGLSAESFGKEWYTVDRSNLLGIVTDLGISPSQSDMTEEQSAAFQEASANEDWMASVLLVYPWCDPGEARHWAQLTVLPTDEVGELTDEALTRAVTLTRFGWNLTDPGVLEPELAEIRRHLAAPTAVYDVV